MSEMNMIMLKSAEGEILLPADIVRQVLPYAPLMQTAATLDCIMGNLIVQNERLPVIRLLGEGVKDSAMLVGVGAKLVWIRSVGEETAVSSYILVSDTQPRIVSCSAEQLQNEESSEKPYIAYQADLKLADEEDVIKVFVPDLIALEKDLEKE